jgi:hypothetical protein
MLARYYRDSAGRVRAEQLNDDGARATLAPALIVIDSDPEDALVFAFDPAAQAGQQSHRAVAEWVFTGGTIYAVPLGRHRFGVVRTRIWMLGGRGSFDSIDEDLGIRRVAGINTIGRRVTTPARPGQTDGVCGIVDERWEATDLKVLVSSRYEDPDIVVYQFTDIRRAEPPAYLFSPPGAVTASELRISLEPLVGASPR